MLVNGGSATWRSRGEDGLQLSYHWLDRRGNAIVVGRPAHAVSRDRSHRARRSSWTCPSTRPDRRGATCSASTSSRSTASGSPRSASRRSTSSSTSQPLIGERRLAVVVHGGPDARTEAALAAQEEPLVDERPAATAHLVAGAEPAPDWSRRLLDAHAEGWAAVGPALVPAGGPLERRRAARTLARWAPGGRNPRLEAPLLLPSLVDGLAAGEHEGLPAYVGEGLFEGRAVVRLPTRSGRRPH